MTTAAIVQARISSSRLPAKVLLPLPNRHTVLQEVLLRCFEIANVDIVVLAIPKGDDILLGAIPAGVTVYAGSEKDVLSRYAGAARAVNADTILRVTSDCPCIDPRECERVIKVLKDADADYACNNDPRVVPIGLDCEAFPRRMLERADAEAIAPYDREHVGPFIKRNARITAAPSLIRSDLDLRLTLDTIDDYRRIYAHMAAAA